MRARPGCGAQCGGDDVGISGTIAEERAFAGQMSQPLVASEFTFWALLRCDVWNWLEA